MESVHLMNSVLNRSNSLKFVSPIFLMLMVLIFSGCGKSPEPRKRQGILDSPAHHVLRGQDLIQQKRWNAAQRQFDSALELDPEFPPALSGKSLVKAHQLNQKGRKLERVETLREESKNYLEN